MRCGDAAVPCAPMRVSKHIPALDGVRGIAIALVLAYHSAVFGQTADDLAGRVARLGWCGVDLFFVLSGFLITGILLDGRADLPTFGAFFGRRVRRIFPLYYGALAVYFCVLARFSDVGDAHEAAWYVTYLSNVRIATHGWPSRSAIDQFWSLAIEEQFYLVWPVIVLGRSRATVVRFCLAIFGIALLTRIGFGFAGNYDAIYVLTPCRADALAAGAMAAVAVRSNVASSVAARLVVISAVVWLTVVACVRLRYWTDQPAVYAIGMPSFALLCASAVAYLASVPSNNRYARALSVAPLRALGKYSYAIYVFQQGAMIAAHRLLSPHLKTVPSVLSIVTIGGAGSALSIVAAIASWHLYEKRFLSSNHPTQRSVALNE